MPWRGRSRLAGSVTRAGLKPWLSALIGVLACACAGPAAAADALMLRIDGAIGPATAEYLVQGLEQARQRQVAFVLLELDTPGGLDSSMRDIIKAMLAAPFPIVGYVAPSGARAASAGTYILYATHVAAMAPGTNLGAATPIEIGSGDSGSGRAAAAEVGLHEKMVNDAVAYIRSLAELRGRNADWAEKAVRDAATLSAEAALKEGVIDLVAGDRAGLLARIDGRTVRVGQTEARLDTKGITVATLAPSWRSRLLSFITDPSIAYILLMVGTYGIIAEFWAPGTIIPGLTGVICLLLAFYAFQLLPVDETGVALVLLGLGLMVAETFVASFGALGVAGIVAFVAGSIMLFDTGAPGYAIPWPLIAAAASCSGLVLLASVVLVMRNRRRAVVTGAERLLQAPAEVIQWRAGRGWVRIHGERWEAVGPADLVAGDQTSVAGRRGLTLMVERKDSKA
jgi:membrane-bound serine protease (ClpP class)